MEPKRKPKIMNNPFEKVTKIKEKKKEMKIKPGVTLSPISSQRKSRHSAGKLNLKKTQLQR